MKKIFLILLIQFTIVNCKGQNDNKKSDLAHNIEIPYQTEYDKLDLYHNAMMIHVYNEKGSVDYLKKNNIALYHHGLMIHENQESAEYLKKNNIALYHHAMLIFGNESSLNYFEK